MQTPQLNTKTLRWLKADELKNKLHEYLMNGNRTENKSNLRTTIGSRIKNEDDLQVFN